MFVEVDEFVTDTHEVNFDEEDIWSILFFVYGCVRVD